MTRLTNADVAGAVAEPGRIDVIDRADEMVVKPTGVIDLLTAPRLDEVLSRAATQARKRVVVDLSETSLLAGVGIGVIAATDDRLRSTGRSLVVTGAHGVVERALAACDMSDVVDGDICSSASSGGPVRH